MKYNIGFFDSTFTYTFRRKIARAQTKRSSLQLQGLNPHIVNIVRNHNIIRKMFFITVCIPQ